eukprot:846307-Prymnesium_polylepis.1
MGPPSLARRIQDGPPLERAHPARRTPTSASRLPASRRRRPRESEPPAACSRRCRALKSHATAGRAASAARARDEQGPPSIKPRRNVFRHPKP